MKATVIRIPPDSTTRGEEIEFPGWIVDDTNGSLAIDQRYEADIEAIPPVPAFWVITHVPTGRRINKGDYFSAGWKAEAARKAHAFYHEMLALGVRLESSSLEEPREALKKLTEEERVAIFKRIADAVQVAA